MGILNLWNDLCPVINSVIRWTWSFAANGDLYMLEYGTGWFTANDDVRLIRIEYNAGNRTPSDRVEFR